ncbi:MAG: hypothetical protein JOZ62_16795 [Acidobacteriaceae bacterium]|nr:hypothetical protein [Acidobacteriaceae bacterium]
MPADAETLETAIDASGTAVSHIGDTGDGDAIPAFDNIETGVLERDLATHEPAPLEETDEGEVLDLGRVEGLSGAPSTLHNVAATGEAGDADKSDNIGDAE